MAHKIYHIYYYLIVFCIFFQVYFTIKKITISLNQWMPRILCTAHHYFYGVGENIINKLPVLDLGNRRGSTDYIDFIRVNEMKYSLMKGIDCHRRPFIAFKCSVYSDKKKPRTEGHSRYILSTIHG